MQLTEEQKARIERNCQQALAIRATKADGSAASSGGGGGGGGGDGGGGGGDKGKGQEFDKEMPVHMGSGFRAGFSLLLPRSLSLSLSLCLSQTHTHLHTPTHTHTHPTLSLLDSGTPLLLRRKRKRQQTCREGASSRRFQHRTSLSMKRHRLPTPRNERSPRC